LNPLKVQNTTKNSVIVKFAIIMAVIVITTLAYYFPAGMINIIHLRAQTRMVADGSSAVKMIEIKGESCFRKAQIHTDNPTRTAAIIDAIRLYHNYIMLKNSISINNEECWDWGELRLTSKSVANRGLLLNEEIMVTIISEDKSESNNWWMVNNKKLIDSNLQDSLMLQVLSDILTINGAKLYGGKRIGRNIWQETIYFPES
jgi:hypothetical protein